MPDFHIRTEDLKTDEILGLYVETQQDRRIVDSLKAPSPIVIEGSRGTGKSFLLRVAEAQLLKEFTGTNVLPVYVSFVRSSLIHTSDPQQFQHWMMARLCDRILRALYKQGLLTKAGNSLSVLIGSNEQCAPEQSVMETIARTYEESYRTPGVDVDASSVPSVDVFKDAIEDLCDSIGIKRIVLLFDEAAHIFRPEQQRQFFTLFRDLRSPYLNCNAAVYPGVTMYGPSFQATHDATLIQLNRDVLDKNYLASMRDIVAKQADSELLEVIARNGENFNALAYAVSGNPRLLLKTVGLAPKLNSTQVTDVLKTFYRSDIWTEHSELAERYAGHRALVDWGRFFIESNVIPDTRAKNDAWLQQETGESTCSIWIHRDAPAAVVESLRLLAYTGIVAKGDSGIIAGRGEVGTRYSINLGCLAAPESHPIKALTHLGRTLTARRFTEFGPNSAAFKTLTDSIGNFAEPDMSNILQRQLDKSVSVLDITDFQKSALRQIGLETIGTALQKSEEEFRKVEYIGPIRSRRMKNAVVASVLEYLSG